MSATALAARLGRAQREGRGWRTICPVHGGYSLNVADGRDGTLLVTCWAGCDPAEILAALRRFAPDDQFRFGRRHDYQQNDAQRRIEIAWHLWDRLAEAQRSRLGPYLRSRGITEPVPRSLRWAASCRHPTGIYAPAMVAKVVNVDDEFVGVHRTYLNGAGSGKAAVDPQKAMLGRVVGGAVRLAAAIGTKLAVTEGIETGLSVQQVTGIPTWAALSAPGLRALQLPPAVTHVIVFGDHDCNGVGEDAARQAGQRWLAEGRSVSLVIPTRPATDFNDILRGAA